MNLMRNCARPTARRRSGVILLALALICAGTTTEVSARSRRGDRFGLRIGNWPQSSMSGNLGRLAITRDDGDLDTVVARFDEPSAIVPFLELYGLFHVKGMWSIEAAIGYSMRKNVEVTGHVENRQDSLGLGEGRIDFIPLFAGLRGEFPVGSGARNHNVYVRGGLSLIFASESPSLTHPGIDRVYSPGSEGAPGFVIGGGGEYYFASRYAVTYDMQFRHAWFTYARNAKFNQYGVWVSIGILVSTR
ncbi:MAG TPA: hypothetical protein VM118_08400 [Acidobacteriota bacterium]|nr:hypothetical protein [Acidobacteriota bacterium]